MQSPMILLRQVASRLTLASVFALSSVVGLSAAFAADSDRTLFEPGLTLSDPTVLLAQVSDASILYYTTQNYTVNVFREGNQILMNVYDGTNAITRLSRQPATFTIQGGEGAYVSTGSYSGRQARYAAIFNRSRQLRLAIQDGSNAPIANETANAVAAFRVPDDVLDRIGQQTILNFETASYAVRVFSRGNVNDRSTTSGRFMNVFNNFTAASEVNGQPANVLPNEAPYDGYVSYVTSGTRSGQPVTYVARIDGAGRTLLEIYNVNNQRIFQEQGIGEVTVNIPEADLNDVVSDIPDRVNDAYVAAVFGGEETLRQVQQLFPEAFMDSARQGSFINAGSFPNQDAANLRVLELRSRGFDSRLVYRDVQFR
ncbi:MAG TPA: hypothetical protein V6D02_10315 [Candidatus Obscuribacterales bacterium]